MASTCTLLLLTLITLSQIIICYGQYSWFGRHYKEISMPSFDDEIGKKKLGKSGVISSFKKWMAKETNDDDEVTTDIINMMATNAQQKMSALKKKYDWEVKQGLTDAQVVAIKLYTDNNKVASAFNHIWTQSGKDLPKTYDPYMQTMYSATHDPKNNALFSNELTLYFGAGDEVSDDDIIYDVGSKVYQNPLGHDYQPGFQSTSRSKDVAQRFTGTHGTLYRVTIPKGQWIKDTKGNLVTGSFGAVDVSKLSNSMGEGEVLLFDIPLAWITYEEIKGENYNTVKQTPAFKKITRLRKYTKELSKNKEIRAEVQFLLKQIFTYLLDRVLEKYLYKEKKSNSNIFFDFWEQGAGAVELEENNLHAIMGNEGNIREQLNFILGYARSDARCGYLWRDAATLKDKDADQKILEIVNKDDVEKRLKRIEDEVGITLEQLMNVYPDEKTPKDFSVALFREKKYYWCGLMTRNWPGPATVVRGYALWGEYFRQERKEHPIKMRFLLPYAQDVSPPLSSREIDYIRKWVKPGFCQPKKPHNWEQQELKYKWYPWENYRLPWQTGIRDWSVRSQSPMRVITDNNKIDRLEISGASLSAQLLMDLARQFKDVDLNLILGGIVVYMGNPLDHSLHEILQGVSTLGQTDFKYQIGQDPYDYLDSLLNQRKSKHNTGQYDSAHYVPYLEGSHLTDEYTKDEHVDNEYVVEDENYDYFNNLNQRYLFISLLSIFIMMLCVCCAIVMGYLFGYFIGRATDSSKMQSRIVESI